MERPAIRTEFLSDVLITATEGGINYWAQVTKRRWERRGPDGYEGAVMDVGLRDLEDGDKLHYVTHEMLEKGIALILSTETRFQVREDLYRMILLGHYKNDAAEIDAEAADVIVQAAIFGEIVYS